MGNELNDSTQILHKFTIHNKQIFIQTNCADAIKPLRLMIDTGAQITLINSNALKPETICSRDKQVINGIISHTETLGSVKTKIIIGNEEVNCKFHIVRDANIGDGIIGNDFLLKHCVSIDIRALTLNLLLPARRSNGNLKPTIIHDEVNSGTKKIPQVNFEIESNKKHSPTTTNGPSGEKSSKAFREKTTAKGEKRKNVIKNEVANNDGFEIGEFLKQLNQLKNPRAINPTVIDTSAIENTTGVIRCEPRAVTILQVKTKHIGDLVCHKHQISKHICVENALTTANGENVNIMITNSDSRAVVLNRDQLQCKMIPLANSEHTIWKINCDSNELNRIGEISENLDLQGQSAEMKTRILKICNEFADIFYIDGDISKPIDILKHHIRLKPGAKPVFIKQYRTPEAQRSEITRQLKDLESRGIIEPSTAWGWNAPILLVDKKENSKGIREKRLVVDMRGLNEVTELESFPIPLIDEIIDDLAHSKFFSTLDIYSAFFCVELDTDSRDFTSFQNSYFRYRFKRLPMGLANSPATFQRAMNLIFKDMLGQGLRIYLDDLIIYTKTAEEHFAMLQKIFQRLRENNLKLKIDKTRLLKREVHYLGFIVDEHGSRPNDKNTDTMKHYPRPTNVKEIQRFLGCANYYRNHISNFAQLASPLYKLLRKETPFVWDNACQKSFESLIEKLTSEPLLAFPNFDEVFYLHVDASKDAIGGVLSQGTIPNDKPIQYVSRTLSDTEKRYSTIEREFLAIVFAIESFHHFLWGHEFIVFSDQKPLSSQLRSQNAEDRLVRYRIRLMPYKFTVKYKKGTQNVVADALSRIVPRPDHEMTLDQFLTENGLSVKSINTEFSCSAVTRSNTLRDAQTNDATTHQQQQQNANIESNAIFPNYYIEENNNILTDAKKTDHIFYIFPTAECEMRRKMEHKLKIILNLEKSVSIAKAYEIDHTKTFFVLSTQTTSSYNAQTSAKVIEAIKRIAQTNAYHRIAVNVDIRHPQCYFLFKTKYQEVFANTAIETTFFVNKTMEITQIDDINTILHDYHSTVLAGHPGSARMLANIRRFFHWPSMKKDVVNFVKNCSICEKSKITRHTRMPMAITSTAATPYEKIYIDFIGRISPKSHNGNEYIFVCMCDLTKHAVAVATPAQTAEVAAHCLVEEVILKFGIPLHIVSDNGGAFISNLFKNVTKLLKAKQLFITPYNPSANKVERLNRTLAQHIIAFTENRPNAWDEELPYAMFAYNNSVSTATGFSPNRLLFGTDTQLPSSITGNNAIVYNYDRYDHELRQKLQRTWQLAKETREKNQLANKERIDEKQNAIHLMPGDMVLALKPFKLNKFENPYEGPYRVLSLPSDNYAIIDKKKKGQRETKININKLKRACGQLTE